MEVTPPPDVWANVEKHLDKKRRGGVIYIWSALAAGIALLIGIETYLRSDFRLNTKEVKHNITASAPAKPAIAQPETKSINNNQKNNNTLTSLSFAKNNLHQDVTNSANAKPVSNDKEVESGNSSNVASIEPTINKQETEVTETQTESVSQVANNNQANVSKPVFLMPLGARLNASAKPHLITQPEKPQETAPALQIEPLTPELADNTETKKEQRWSIMGQAAPLYSYRSSNQSNTSGQNQEKGLIAYAGGIKIDYKTSRRLSIQAGMFYSVMGQVIDNVSISSYQSSQSMVTVGYTSNNFIVNTSNSLGPISKTSNSGKMSADPNNFFYGTNTNNRSSNVVLSDNLTTTKQGSIVQEMKFIELPLLARYKIIDKKIGVHLLGGIGTSILVNNSATLKQDGNSESLGKTQYLNPINLNSTLGFGINYILGRNLDLSIEPTYKFYLNSISTSDNNDFRPYSFGLFTGIVYKF